MQKPEPWRLRRRRQQLELSAVGTVADTGLFRSWSSSYSESSTAARALPIRTVTEACRAAAATRRDRGVFGPLRLGLFSTVSGSVLRLVHSSLVLTRTLTVTVTPSPMVAALSQVTVTVQR
jgi:hypothetical protein